MVTFLFWNLKRNDRRLALARMVKLHDIDVVMLAECPLGVAEVLRELNSAPGSGFHYNAGNCEKITVYSKFATHLVPPIHEESRMSIRHMKIPGAQDWLLAVVHLGSKLHNSDASQTIAATEISRSIVSTEKKIGHSRTVLVGDLNMNPFEHGIVAASGLHATMDRRIAEKRGRMVERKVYPFFYNPMWSLLGDASPGPPGTYFSRQSQQLVYFWHMFDQVLLRPEVLPKFQNKDLMILDSDGTSPFLKPSGVPDVDVASDHLPILFRLSF